MPDQLKPINGTVVSIADVLARREAVKRRKERMVGNCQRPVDQECGMKNPAECVIHGPYLPEDAL